MQIPWPAYYLTGLSQTRAWECPSSLLPVLAGRSPLTPGEKQYPTCFFLSSCHTYACYIQTFIPTGHLLHHLIRAYQGNYILKLNYEILYTFILYSSKANVFIVFTCSLKKNRLLFMPINYKYIGFLKKNYPRALGNQR